MMLPLNSIIPRYSCCICRPCGNGLYFVPCVRAALLAMFAMQGIHVSHRLLIASCTAASAGFVEVDKALANSRIDCEFSGSTAVVAFLKAKTLTTAWVGDSRGVLGRAGKNGQGFEAVSLTKDHKPMMPEEKARIVASNGRVERSGSWPPVACSN